MKLAPRTGSLFLSLLLMVLLFACNDNRIYEESVKIDKGHWNSDTILDFSPVISDTLCAYNIYIDVRNDISYSYSNLYLFLKTVFPNGRIARDTIECQLAGYDGKWLGSGSGNVRSSRFLFQRGIRLPLSGTYRFEVEQAMRAEELKGILDVGIRIDKVN